jgi:hypothetical protein
MSEIAVVSRTSWSNPPNPKVTTTRSTKTLWNYWKQTPNSLLSNKTHGLSSTICISSPSPSPSPSTVLESLSSTEDHESRNSPLICAYCERYVCLSCSKPCWECQELICSLCSRWDYQKSSERLLCGKCYDSCRNMESPSFHDTDEMDWDF